VTISGFLAQTAFVFCIILAGSNFLDKATADIRPS